MSRIEQQFNALSTQGRKALITFITAGDPHPDTTVNLMHTIVANGADIIELGVPFSDPMADGPVIQRASQRALKHKVTLQSVLGMVQEFRQTDQQTPVVLMGYLNPIEAMGYSKFADDAATAGVDAVLLVDMPPEEATPLIEMLKPKGLDVIFLIAPTSSHERIRWISQLANGFLYYVSQRGVTGADHLSFDEIKEKVALIRQESVLPVGVGFGIDDADTAATVAELADAVVVGSALIKRIEKYADKPERLEQEVRTFMQQLRSALDLHEKVA